MKGRPGRALAHLAVAACLASPAAGLRAGGSFDTGYGIWSPSGLWHRVSGPACVTPSSGAACVYYGMDASCDYATGQAQDSSLTTVSPVPLAAGDASVDFWLLYQVQSFDPACQDRLRLEYSPDGATWYLADDDLTVQSDPPGGAPFIGYSSGGGIGGPPLWQHLIVSLAAYAGTDYYWRFRYLSSDSQAGNPGCGPPDLFQGFLGFALDDVRLGQAPLPLELSKSVSPAVGAPGDTFTFVIDVVNTGASAADVAVWDTLPQGVAYAAALGGTISAGLARWSLASLPAGQGASVTLLAQAAPGTAVPADWVDQAEASSSLTTTPLLSPQVLAKVRAPGLSLLKTAQPGELASGENVTYSLLVENDTPLTQSALTLADQLPAGFSPAQAYPQESGPGAWILPSLAPGQVATAELWGPLFGQDGQVVVNVATVAGAGSATATASASVTVRNPVRPSITLKAVFPNPAPAHSSGAPEAAFIDYHLSVAMAVNLDVYDVSGQRVRSLSLPGGQGDQQGSWDLRNAAGRQVAAGLYVLRLWSPLEVQPQPQAIGYLAVVW